MIIIEKQYNDMSKQTPTKVGLNKSRGDVKPLICMLVWVDEKLKLVIYSGSIIVMLKRQSNSII